MFPQMQHLYAYLRKKLLTSILNFAMSKLAKCGYGGRGLLGALHFTVCL